jgi:molecular chaperone DnaK (HSP70)
MIEKFGVTCLAVIAEPNSAFLGWLFDTLTDESSDMPEGFESLYCLIVDIGGGTSDISFCMFNMTSLECLAISGTYSVCGCFSSA